MELRLLSLAFASADQDLMKRSPPCVSPSSAGSTYEGEACEMTSDSDHCCDDSQQGLQPNPLHVDLPSIGSASHEDGNCKRCCFFPKGRCGNGYACEYCHYDHDKRKRTKRKHKQTSHNAPLVDEVEAQDASLASFSLERSDATNLVDVGSPPGLEAIVNARAAIVDPNVIDVGIDMQQPQTLRQPKCVHPQHCAEASSSRLIVGDLVCLNAQGCVAPEDYTWADDALAPGAIGEVVVGGNYPCIRGMNGKTDQYWENDLQKFVPQTISLPALATTPISRSSRPMVERQSEQADSCIRVGAPLTPPGLELHNGWPMFVSTDWLAPVNSAALPPLMPASTIEHDPALLLAPNSDGSERLSSYPDAGGDMLVVGDLVRLNAHGCLVPDDYCWDDDALSPEQVAEVVVGGVYPYVRGPGGTVDQYWYGDLQKMSTNGLPLSDHQFRPPPGLELDAPACDPLLWERFHHMHGASPDFHGISSLVFSLPR